MYAHSSLEDSLWVHIECLQGTPGTVGWTLKMEKAKGPAIVGWKNGRNSV